MKFLSPLMFFGLLACVSVPLPGVAKIPCGDPVEIREGLHKNYVESLRGWGLSDAGKLVEVYTNETFTHTWTLLTQKPGKATCVVSVGVGTLTVLLQDSTVEDSAGRMRIWVGVKNEKLNTFAFEIFVNRKDNSWQIKRTNGRTGAIMIMIEGSQWSEVLADDGRKT